MKRVYHQLKNSSRVAVILLIAIIVPVPLHSQTTRKGSLDYLQLCNGFKGLILGSDQKYMSDFKLAYLDDDDKADTDDCFRYEYKDDEILSMGNGLSLDLVGIRTYKNQIVNIYLFFKSEDGAKVLQMFLAEYGKYTKRPGDFMYDWNTSSLKLSLRYQGNADLGVATFTCNRLEEQIKNDKLKASRLSELVAAFF